MGWNDDEPPPHSERADNLPDLSEGRPPTPPRQPSSSNSKDNIQVVVSQNRRTPEPVPPPRYYVSQHLNLLGAKPTISSGPRPDETLAHNETTRVKSEVGGDQIKTPENRVLSDLVDDDDLPPLPMAPRPAPARPQMPISLSGLFIPPEGHHIVSKPIACKLGGGKAPRLSEVHCDRDSVCVKTDT